MCTTTDQLRAFSLLTPFAFLSSSTVNFPSHTKRERLYVCNTKMVFTHSFKHTVSRCPIHSSCIFIDSDVFYFVVCVCVRAGALLRPRSI